MSASIELKHADGTLVTAQEAYDAFMTTRVLIDYNGTIYSVAAIEWYDNNSAHSDPTNVGYVIMYYYNTNAGSTTSLYIGDSSLNPT